MKKNLLNLLLLSFFAISSAFAQSRKITGSVTSADEGQPLPGVSIKIVGTNQGTQSNADGNFSLNVAAGAKSLQFSYLGYSTLTVPITSANTYTVKLQTDNKALSEIVVTGYGVQQKREVTGSIVSLKAVDIEDKPIQTMDRALQGRAAGVQVTSSSGQPGGGLSVVIRGTATINGTTQPLYIVDGVQLSTGGLSGQTSVNSLSSINPDDIESIEVLKDAASASIYGSLAGNGVVIITTKRGKAGKTTVNASAQFGEARNYNPYKTVSGADYFLLQKEAYENYNQRIGNAPGVGTAAAITASFPSGVLPANIPTYDYVKGITQTGKVGQYDLSFSGGDAKTKFFVAGSYNNTQGTIINSSFTRGTFRANVDHKVSDKFTMQAAINLTGSGEAGPSTNSGFFTNTPFTGAILTSPINPIYNADGSYNTATVGINAGNNIIQNVVQEVRTAGTFQTVSNLGLTYSILPELSFRAFGGLEFSDIRDVNYRPATIPIYAPLGSGVETYRRNINYNTSGTFNFTKKFGEHNFSAIAGFEYRSVTNRVESASSQGFPSPLLILVSSGSTPTAATSTFTGYRVAGFLGNAKYDYKGKYLFSANIRRDGSSRFGPNKKYGTFYGFSGGWNMMSESFMNNVKFISQLKPRVSYGVTGSQPTTDFTGLSLYGGGGQYGAPLAGGLRPAQLANPDFTWEKSTQIDLGLDYGFFNNRITGQFDIYRKKNTDLILGLTLPGDSGFTSYTVNAGAAQSEGIELQISSVNVDGPFKWTTNFNISWNRTKLLQLVNGLQQTGTFTYTVGSPLQNIYTQQWAGVNPADGRAMYYDINGNITYAPKTTDQRIIGNQLPRFYGGFGNTFTYAGFNLDVLLQYQYGNKSYLQTQQYLETSGDLANNQAASQLTRWTTPGQITSVPRPYVGSTGAEPGGVSVQTLSSRFVEDASYIRLKQVTLGYKLPKSVTDKVKVGSVSLFLQALNLATITHYRGDDPENTGNNLNFYPNARTLTAGINVKF
ncbi:TonB-dependent receptor [Mucilaginibacter mali]|uniref:TonB-dependent receptor n=1 Tax=Mucilaginibacter mali TaxID=2740462 RepID=A0A7D4UNG9_9SPHI|nr:TonB-dependent receptor [Mucilaginibacter mali]QKJ28960.1 TonB-dependent receptor [Mucilaginibacter mali]